ncbi:unnamed protein product [Rotaria socialis]|uniref:Insulin-like domain-containing protein n=1 Tax=Rotaria socialis TaxID=392032 RepID=A0A818JGI5_9BILA|nr:unnamed protein product [Rotaria socialis]CAF3743430.1 unnamed protein product [Rotaria socialis]CAF4611047.1 unnamed protein product [Rotaria socialis]CAF4694196.1 unnamed protein product [Rotaria socialis]
MFRSSFIILLTLIIIFTNGNNITIITNESNMTSPIQNTTTTATTITTTTTTTTTTATRKPSSIKLCGPALVRMLEMVCDKVKQFILKAQVSESLPSSSHEKRHMIVDDDPYTHTLLVKDYAQFNNTIIGNCCLQACTLKTLIEYC